ncbi:response regulator [Parathermosynechococcus lividus]|nr:response regulator [Thermostichus lividus]
MQAFENTRYPSASTLEAVMPLPQMLQMLRTQQFTGIVRVAAHIPDTGRHLAYDLSVYHGNLTMAAKNLPTPEELLWLLGRMLKVGFMDTLMQYAQSRTANYSYRAILEAVVNTRALSWEDIEKAMTERLVTILERLAPHTCTIESQPNPEWDLSYGDLPHGIDPSTLLERIDSRKSLWQQLYPAIPSFEAIPRLHEGALATIHHEATAQHLQTWVNGENTIADIAEALYKDSLALASLYLRWVNDGLIGFVANDDSPVGLPIVLSVDDSPIVQAMIRRALGDRYEVISATSAIDALSLLNNRNVSLILLDVTMPEIDGFEFCRTIRKIEKFKEIPVIMLTAKDGLIDRAKGHMAGTNYYLTKPVDRDVLLSTIEKFI